MFTRSGALVLERFLFALVAQRQSAKFNAAVVERLGTRLLNGIDAGAIPAGGSTFYAPHAEAVEATACKAVLTRCESGAALHFSPRDVTDSMRGFEPRRQGATPCVETNFGR